MYTFDESIVSDLFKDAYGFRPSSGWWDNWNNASSDEKQAIWDRLGVSLSHAMEEEKERELRALSDFEQTILSTISYGAGTRETALRWLTQSEEFDDDQDVEHWVWKQGILFTEAGRQVCDQLMEMWGLKRRFG